MPIYYVNCSSCGWSDRFFAVDIDTAEIEARKKHPNTTPRLTNSNEQHCQGECNVVQMNRKGKVYLDGDR